MQLIQTTAGIQRDVPSVITLKLVPQTSRSHLNLKTSCQTVSAPALLLRGSSQLLCLKWSVFQGFWSREHLGCTLFFFKPRENLKNLAWKVGFYMVSLLYGWLSIDERCWSHQGGAQGQCSSGLGRTLTWTPNSEYGARPCHMFCRRHIPYEGM